MTLITQTSVLPDHDAEFAAWQQRISDAVASFPGFIDHKVIPPTPPAQADWVIVQRFATTAAASVWLASPERRRLIEAIQPIIVGRDDIHVVEDDAPRPPDAVSAVISQRIAPGNEERFRAWGQKIVAAQAQFPGFQGFKLNPPVPGIQDDWVTIIQFDTEPHLNDWIASPQRRALLAEAAPFLSDIHHRTVRSGFDQWFRVDGAAMPPAWKQNLLVLMALYPVAFLFGHFVQTPLLMGRLGLPFWLAFFVGNAAGILILSQTVPWISEKFAWWLQPAGSASRRNTLIGVAVVAVIYLLLLMLMMAVSRTA